MSRVAKKLVFNMLRNHEKFEWTYDPSSDFFTGIKENLALSILVHRTSGVIQLVNGEEHVTFKPKIDYTDVWGTAFTLFLSQNDLSVYHLSIAEIEKKFHAKSDELVNDLISKNKLPNWMLD